MCFEAGRRSLDLHRVPLSQHILWEKPLRMPSEWNRFQLKMAYGSSTAHSDLTTNELSVAVVHGSTATDKQRGD